MMDFSSMIYDVSKPGLVIEHYPDLENYPEFSNPDKDLLLKFAFLISDEQSPFVRAEKNFTGIVAATAAYLNIDDHDFLTSVIAGYGNRDADDVFNMQCTYFRMLNNWEYNTWYDLMYQYHENSLVLRTPLNATDKDYEKKAETKQKIRNYQVELSKTIIQYEAQIFPSATNVKRVITKHVSKITNWPEKMAREKLIQDA